MLYLGVSKTHEEQLHILEALTRKFRLAPDLDLREVAEKCSFNLTGADFYALCSDALLNAMTRKAEDLEKVIGEPFPCFSCPGAYSYAFQHASTRSPKATTTLIPSPHNTT